MIVRGVLLPERLVAAYGRAIARTVRDQMRRDHVTDNALSVVLDELDSYARLWATPSPTAATTAGACEPDCRSVNVDTCTVQAAAELIGCQERNVRDLIARAVLPAERAPKGNGWLIDKRAVEVYSNRRTDRERTRNIECVSGCDGGAADGRRGEAC